MKRWSFVLLAAVAALGLQACDQEPPRTTVLSPGPSQPDDTVLHGQAPAPAPAAVTAQEAASAPAAPVAADATQPPTAAMGAAAGPSPSPAEPAATPADATPAGTAAPTEMSGAVQPARPASAGKPDKVSALPSVRDAGDAEGTRLLAQRSLQVPVAGVQATALADNFTQSRGARKHEAIDILAPAGTPVVAVDDGRVAKLFTSKPGGLTVYQFDRDARLAYYYAHLQGYAPGVREGMDVKRGDLIGYVGSTGNADVKTPHLHFAVFRLGQPPKWWEGEAVNPYPALAQSRFAAR